MSACAPPPLLSSAGPLGWGGGRGVAAAGVLHVLDLCLTGVAAGLRAGGVLVRAALSDMNGRPQSSDAGTC